MEDEEEGKLKFASGGHSVWEDKEGNFHRLNGPAVIFVNGDTFWLRHGQLHREHGPARIWPAAHIEHWYKDGKRYEPSAHELMLWKLKKKQQR